MDNTVKEKDLWECLVKLRDLKLWAVANKIDPWAFRQMLLIALEMDTRASLEKGVIPSAIQKFDSIVKKDMQQCLDLLATATNW